MDLEPVILKLDLILLGEFGYSWKVPEKKLGSLAKSLEKVWNNYNQELKRYIWNLSSMMEPIIIVIV